MAHICEPPHYPTSLGEAWDCPECGTEYTAFDPFALVDSRLTPYLLPDTFGWMAVSTPRRTA